MAQTIELFIAFATGTSDYIARHNNNYSIIQNVINQMLAQLTGQSGDMAVPAGLQEILDRRGVVGDASYDFNDGTLVGPAYNLAVGAGAYWSGQGGTFYSKKTGSVLSLAGKAAGTYYINLDGAGNPLASTTPDASTTRQFSWDGAGHVSAKAFYAGVSVLFDGDDYADCLTSAFRGKSFTRLATRLEEIEQLSGKAVQTPAPADTVTIDWSLGGHARLVLDRPSTTVNMSGAYDGQKCTLELVQDGVGGRAVVLGTGVGVGVDLTAPVPLSSAGGKRDLLGFIYSAGNSKCNYVSLSRGF